MTTPNPSTMAGEVACATPYRGRFAPSPTGPLHFGSMVAALAGYLEARRRSGAWLVRIEDLDPPRNAAGAAEEILRTLTACGLQWNGDVVYQSRRAASYHAALHRLRSRRLLYPCACSRREIADSAAHGIEGPVYPGTCRKGVMPGRAARAWRVATGDTAIGFVDAVQGRVHQALAADIGDFVLYRAPGIYAYQLAVVVDDAAQGITHVVRGADLLASTPRQIYLQKLLGLPTPRYLHVPTALDRAGEKLSKQTHALPVDAQRPLPALVRALDFLGQQPPGDLAHGTLAQYWGWACRHWRIERVPRCLSVTI